MAKRVNAYLSDQAIADLTLVLRYFEEKVGITLSRSTAIDIAIRKAAEAYGLKREEAEVTE